MEQQYVAVPILAYIPALEWLEEQPKLKIFDALREASPDSFVFLAEDFLDGVVKIDPSVEELSGRITQHCKLIKNP